MPSHRSSCPLFVQMSIGRCDDLSCQLSRRTLCSLILSRCSFTQLLRRDSGEILTPRTGCVHHLPNRPIPRALSFFNSRNDIYTEEHVCVVDCEKGNKTKQINTLIQFQCTATCIGHHTLQLSQRTLSSSQYNAFCLSTLNR